MFYNVPSRKKALQKPHEEYVRIVDLGIITSTVASICNESQHTISTFVLICIKQFLNMLYTTQV